MLVPLTSEKRPKGDPVYRDPDNPFNTWTGIGKRPAWLNAKLDAGISLESMRMEGATNPKESKPAKYRDPRNSENTWTGTGRRPRWLNELLESGISLDDLKI
ncbi:H-NS histone family protein [Salmonella enterica subsp. enterica serovar Meleagridis]|nr:H-NS histone family protein [Salmonella enterica subsp. enterica serovar Cerro]EGD4263640.1 H-NS histone family protein [Salmonella enterica subsp. enterica serovar Cerro]EGD4267991.1 H-NS histone family protein [Salmonella enterica subsp. enterica serovar Cerro]EGD4276635.1 H-NS histone family protein [Salmonella enterica subsp. enterica serovar Meleagridis]EGD4286638.1 H-NS histone family protein [Salmonella enterica subsp. enterica serovar Meleagridis]